MVCGLWIVSVLIGLDAVLDGRALGKDKAMIEGNRRAEYPENEALAVWERDGNTYSIFEHPSGHYCGYCRMPVRPVIEKGYHGFLVYVPAHGGITYSEESADGTMVYGFDCAHSGDDKPESPTHNLEWVAYECEKMAKAIEKAGEYEDRYLLARDNEEKATVIQAYHDELVEIGIEFVLQDNFLAMANVIFGML